MSYLTNLEKVKETFLTKAKIEEDAADKRRRDLHEAIPAVAEIDQKLSTVGLRLFRASISGTGNIDQTVAAVRRECEELKAQRAQLLQANGYPVDFSDPHYECPICHDSGYVNCKMCACMRRALVRENIRTSGIGDALFSACNFDNFDLSYYTGTDRERMEINLKTAKNFAKNCMAEHTNLLLYGATGLGKTHLSTAIAKDALDNGLNVFYNTAIGMLADFEQAQFHNDAFDGDAVNTSVYTTCDVLILDDVGTEVVNQFTQSVFYHVISTRLNNGLPTVINTNLKFNDQSKDKDKNLETAYGERIYSRLIGNFRLLPFAGVDVRRQKLMKK